MKTAWLIDDDGEMSTAVGLMLKLLDYRPRAFLAAKSAGKRILAGEKADVILLDINMPEVSGKDFLKFVRGRNELSEVPVVMLSSEFAEAQKDDFLESGADAFLSKPVSIDELERAIKEAVGHRSKK